MDIEEILTLKNNLEDELFSKIMEFEKKTKVHVYRISLVEQQEMGRRYLRTGGVECEVKL